MLSIGSQKINTNIFLASLSGCSDLPFRLIAREMGAEFCFYEMIDAHSLAFQPRPKNNEMLSTTSQDLPIAAQLLGSDPNIMLRAAEKILEINPKVSFLDINAACPVKKVIKKKVGAYLINKPDPLYCVIEKLATTLPIPITVKLRTGYSKKDKAGIIKIAHGCEESGAKAIFIHGRTQAQLYAGDVDFASIKAIKDKVKIPVIASGNIFSAEKAKEMLDKTGCDGILVARGAFGNPWIFRQIKTYLTEGILLPAPSLHEKLAVLTRHIQYIEKYKVSSAKVKVGLARKAAIWYLKGFEHAAMLRDKVGRAQSFQELYALIDNL
jgi:nifR3 family TIM-barrel protein